MSCSIIYGAIFTGKTTELNRRLKVELDTGASVIYIKYLRNDSEDSHNSQLNLTSDGVKKMKLNRLSDFTADKYDVIGIDDFQFFDTNSDIEVVRDWVLCQNKTVILASLAARHDLRAFGKAHILVPLCAKGQISVLGGRCRHCIDEGRKREESVGSFSSSAPLRGNGHASKDLYELTCLHHHPDASKQAASCSIIFGGMFTGKTTELTRRLKVELDTGASVVYINHSSDTRNDSAVSTHNSQLNLVTDGITKVKLYRLSDFTEVKEYEVIGVDEIQFFEDIEVIYDWVKYQNKTVIVAGLNGSYDLLPFGKTYSLIPLCAAGQVNILGGRCHYCIEEGKRREQSVGSFSRLKSAKDAVNDNKICIGGDDKYELTCLHHHKSF